MRVQSLKVTCLVFSRHNESAGSYLVRISPGVDALLNRFPFG